MNLLRCVLMAEMLRTPLALYLLSTFRNMSKGVSRLWHETYCWVMRGIVFGLVLVGEFGGEGWSCMGTLTGFWNGVTGV